MGLAAKIGRPEASHAPAIAALKALTARDMESVNAEILRRMESPVEMIPTLAGHLINSGGKRLRPMLTLAAARLFGYEGADHIRLAAAVEFIHTATLLHDDVVDESDLRRGDATANAIWGNQASVLVGDFLFSRSFELMVSVGDLKVLKILSSASSVIAEGEVMQLTTQHNIDTTYEMHLSVVEAKTAALFAAAAEVGAVIAGAGEAAEDALRRYGRSLGVAYQLVDDALDYSGAEDAIGKSPGDDFREGKMTLPIVIAYERGAAEEKAFWKRTIADKVQKDGDFATARRLLDRHNALQQTTETALKYVAEAKEALSVAPEGPEKAGLAALADFAAERLY